MPSKRLIIFDMDGTLIDSSPLLANAINHVRAQLHLPPLAHDAIIGHVNNHHINPAKYFYETDHFEPIHEEWFAQYYTENHTKQLRLYEGILSLLSHLKSEGKWLALATNAHRISALESLQHLAIKSFFDVIVCHDDVAEAKPAPDMLLYAVDVAGQTIETSLFVGDGPRDEEAAQAAGMDYIMVDWGFTEHAEGKKVIKTVRELQEEIDRR